MPAVRRHGGSSSLDTIRLAAPRAVVLFVFALSVLPPAGAVSAKGSHGSGAGVVVADADRSLSGDSLAVAEEAEEEAGEAVGAGDAPVYYHSPLTIYGPVYGDIHFTTGAAGAAYSFEPPHGQQPPEFAGSSVPPGAAIATLAAPPSAVAADQAPPPFLATSPAPPGPPPFSAPAPPPESAPAPALPPADTVAPAGLQPGTAWFSALPPPTIGRPPKPAPQPIPWAAWPSQQSQETSSGQWNTQPNAAVTTASYWLAPAPAPTGIPSFEGSAGRSSLMQLVEFKVQNVDYAALEAEPSVKTAFEQAIIQEVAKEANVVPARVVLELTPGSVNVVASVDAAAGGAALKNAGVFAHAVATGIADVSGIAAVSTGAIHVDISNAHRGTLASAISAAAADGSGGMCLPGCVPGHGVCKSGTCFCMTPFTGLQCEKRIHDDLPRVEFSWAVLILIGAMGAGVLIGWVIFRTWLKARGDVVLEDERPAREVWKPA